jgi:hypothetical protein
MGEVIDLNAVRERKARAEAPARRKGRPYRYDPGPLEGKRAGSGQGPAPSDPSNDEDKTPA